MLLLQEDVKILRLENSRSMFQYIPVSMFAVADDAAAVIATGRQKIKRSEILVS